MATLGGGSTPPLGRRTTGGGSITAAPSTSRRIGGLDTRGDVLDAASAGDLSVSVGITNLSFYSTPGASATASQLLTPGPASAISYVAPFRGRILGISFKGNANKTAGTASFSIYVNGASVSSSTVVSWTSGTSSGYNGFASGSYGFAKGDTLDIRITTDSSYAPTTTVVVATLFIAFDPVDAV